MTMGVLQVHTRPIRFSSATSFQDGLRRNMYWGAEDLKYHIQNYGKPHVRVAAPRQVPNEADL